MNTDLNGLNNVTDVLGAAGSYSGNSTIGFGTLNDHAALDCFAVWMHRLWIWIGTISLLETSGICLDCVWDMTGFARHDANILINPYILKCLSAGSGAR